MQENPGGLPKKSILIGILILIGVMALVFFIIFRQVTIEELVSAISSVNPFWIILGLALMLAFSFFEGLNIRRPLRLLGYKISPLQSFKYAVLGYFYSSVTPSATGGQPMQIYYMYHDGIRVPHSFLALLVQLFGWSGATVAYAVTGYITQGDLLYEAIGDSKLFLIIGIGVNSVIFAFMLVLIFTRRALVIIKALLHKILGKRKHEGAQKLHKKILAVIVEYENAAGALSGNRDIIWKTLLTSAIQFIGMYSVPFLIYKGMGLTGFSYIQLFLLQAVLYTGVGFVPIPGAAGATEGVFMMIFRIIFPGPMLAGAMVLSRSITLYILLVIYAVVVIIFTHKILKGKGIRK